MRRPRADPQQRRVYLCGPEEVATQVRWLLESRSLKPTLLPLRDQDHEWSHRFSAAGPIPAEIRETMDLLTEVVTLPVRAGIDIALTLDFYKRPDPDVEPMNWPNTAAGELVNRAKYRKSATARDELVAELTRVTSSHPFYGAADYVLAVPGHRPAEYSFGADLAQRVAAAIDRPLLEIRCLHDERPAAKEREVNGPQDLADEFAVPEAVAGRVVLIVDDVWRSGDSMQGVATAARRSGARAVLGLAGARTMRAR